MSESIKTTLVYCNRGDAKVKSGTSGQFISEVPYGVKVNAGDTISVESIAVSTSGTGADVIEIPRVVQNYNYQTNKIQLNFYQYIHHNRQYDIMLPIAKSSGGGGSSIDYYTDNTLATYGYMKSQGLEPSNNGKYETVGLNLIAKEVYGGSRFYLGSFQDNVRYPTNASEEQLTPSYRVFNLLEKDITLAVSEGYDSPANIASTLTQELHFGNVTPNNYMLDKETGDRGGRSLSPFYTEGTFSDFGVTDENGTTSIISSIPPAFNNTGGGTNFLVYSGIIGTLNPFYHYWGSRLLCSGTHTEGTTKNNNLLNDFYGSGVPNSRARDWEVLSLVQVSPSNTFFEGYVVGTNLPYNEATLYKLKRFIHSQKWYDYTQTPKLKTEDLYNPNYKNRWFTSLKFGRYDDKNTTLSTIVKLNNRCAGTGGADPRTKVDTYTFYNKDFWIKNDASPNNSLGVFDAPDYTININGKDMLPYEVSEYFDINVVPVKTEVPPPFTSSGIQYNIGIVIKGFNPNSTNSTTFTLGTDFLVDFAFSNQEALMIMLSSTDTRSGGNPTQLTDLTGALYMGSPEMNIKFDDQRGRFAIERMYWSNFITNDPGSSATANASAGTEAITVNETVNQVYNPGANPIQYAQAGLGLHNISVFDLNDVAQPIDWYDDNDISEKYTNSLFWRLGFRYRDLINQYGKPEIIQQEKYYNSPIPLERPDLFTYPLTTNPKFDTTLLPSVSTYDNKLPAFTLTLARDIENINIACEPNTILANNLPKKLATAMWLIESDIIEGVNYTIDGKPKNVLAVVNRAYSQSDFVFSFASDYKFTATKPFVITHIKSNILTSDLVNADVDDETSIIYKIESIQKQGENIAVEGDLPYEPEI